jgi:hypothetical protein
MNMTLREHLKLSNGNELDIKYPIEIKDSNGNTVYCEVSNGSWYKREYNSDGEETYYENSYGNMRGTPRASVK